MATDWPVGLRRERKKDVWALDVPVILGISSSLICGCIGRRWIGETEKAGPKGVPKVSEGGPAKVQRMSKRGEKRVRKRSGWVGRSR